MKQARLLKSALVAICLFGWPLGASAHVVKGDGTVSVLLHINPDDDPVAGRAATLGLDITDSSGRFAASGCDCRITVKENGKKLLDRAVTSNEALSDGAELVGYTFPYQAVYTVTLTGSPKEPDGFQAFRVDYDVRVDKGPLKPKPFWAKWGLVALVAGAVITAGFFVYSEISHPIDKKPKKRVR